MRTPAKRFTISIPKRVEADLDRAKQACYYKTTQSEMLRDLIQRGLDSLNPKSAAEGTTREKQR